MRHRSCVTPSSAVQFVDYLSYYSIQTVRASFDLITGYHPDRMNREKWLTRIVFLETVAGVPGMMGAMIRHLHSLRLMRRDHGWIHTLLEEVRPPSAAQPSATMTPPCCGIHFSARFLGIHAPRASAAASCGTAGVVLPLTALAPHLRTPTISSAAPNARLALAQSPNLARVWIAHACLQCGAGTRIRLAAAAGALAARMSSPLCAAALTDTAMVYNRH